MKRARKMKGCHSRQKRSCFGPEDWADQKSINDLPYCLLQYILEKVDGPRGLRRCRLVCKLWRSLLPAGDPPFALISNIRSSFNNVFEPHYSSDNPVFHRLRRSYFKILRYESSDSDSVDFESSDSDSVDSESSYSEISDFESWEFEIWNRLKLGYLPRARSYEEGYGCPSVCVQASCKDLLLCAESFLSQRQFYIVNPWTGDWISLPKTLTKRGHYIFPTGLVAKQYPLDLVGYQYKVVRLTDINFMSFGVEVFDPDMTGWREICVLHPYGLSWNPTMFQAIVYEDALHWLAENGPIVAYNPFAPPDANGRSWCRFIKRSGTMKRSGDSNMVVKECVTVSEGYIHMIQLITYPKLLVLGDEVHNLTVWKLEDYKKSKWVLKHRAYFKDMVSDVSWLQEYVREFVARHGRYEQAKRLDFLPIPVVLESFYNYGVSVPRPLTNGHEPEPLACHPSNAEVAYLYFPSSIVSCNLRTKMLKLISPIHQQPMFHKFDTTVPFSASAQPTPVPKCPK